MYFFSPRVFFHYLGVLDTGLVGRRWKLATILECLPCVIDSPMLWCGMVDICLQRVPASCSGVQQILLNEAPCFPVSRLSMLLALLNSPQVSKVTCLILLMGRVEGIEAGNLRPGPWIPSFLFFSFSWDMTKLLLKCIYQDRSFKCTDSICFMKKLFEKQLLKKRNEASAIIRGHTSSALKVLLQPCTRWSSGLSQNEVHM